MKSDIARLDPLIFEEQGIYDNEQGVFIGNDYGNIGGVLFININPSGQESIYKYKFVDNPNALNPYNLPL